MPAVGDKMVLYTQTFLLRDSEIGHMQVPISETKTLRVAIQFRPKPDSDPTVDWKYEGEQLLIDCVGWGDVSEGGSMSEPHQFGSFGNLPLGFNFVHQRVGSINYVTIQFYLGGAYE